MEEENESVYCPICSSCGEDGCCPATMCEQHPDGKYCKGYLRDLQFAYLMYKDMYSHADEKIMTELFDKNYKLIYE